MKGTPGENSNQGARSFRQSWQAFIAALQGSGSIAKSTAGASPAHASLQDFDAPKQASVETGTTAASASETPAGFAYPQLASRTSQLSRAALDSQQFSSRELSEASSAPSTRADQKAAKAAPRDTEKNSPKTSQPLASVSATTAPDTNVPASQAGLALCAQVPPTPIAPPPDNPSAHSLSDSEPPDRPLEKPPARAMNIAVSTSDTPGLPASTGQLMVSGVTNLQAHHQSTAVSSPVPQFATTEPGSESSTTPDTAIRASAFAGNTRLSQPPNVARFASSSTVNQPGKRNVFEDSMEYRPTDLQTPSTDGLNPSACARERITPNEAPAHPRAAAATDKSTARPDPSVTTMPSVGALREDQLQRFSTTNISAPFGTQSAAQAGSTPATPAIRADSVHEAFAAIDSAPAHPATSWTLAGNRHVEAGFQDPSLGWVTVRAQAAAGAIHSTVVPPTAEAAQVLGGHLAGLNAFIASQPVHMSPVTLSAPDAGSGQSMTQGDGQGPNHRGGQQQNSQPAEIDACLHESSGMLHIGSTLDASPVITATPTLTEQHVSVRV